MKNESTIRDLEQELKQIRDQLSKLEKERRSLEAQNVKLNDKSNELVLLKEKIESLINENHSKEVEHQQKLESILQSNEKTIEKIKTDFHIEKESIVSCYESKLSTEKALFEEKLLVLKRVKNKYL